MHLAAAGVPPEILTPGLAQWAGTVILTWITAVYGPRAVRKLATPKERAEAAGLAIESLSEVIDRLREENERLERRDGQREDLVDSLQVQLRDCLAARRADRETQHPPEGDAPW